MELVVLRTKVLKKKTHTMVYTKKCGKDEESVGSSYYITTQGENKALSRIKVDKELEDIF